ncbi:arylsulfatase [Lentisphaera profundi]|uniref:Arylsulfatase n=1 Tax=Lentisphaera profundi TaxID=1658616 RepID=A0ABY7VVV8_9BACT|nr:arylsulfatase [Lentisphaera profundi]WDE96956.1 arylsulfatase [Lentisphaera profundi]
MNKSLMKNKIISSLLFLALSLMTYGEDSKPNIIFIMADDLGIGEIGCYGFNDIIKTPHIDSLATEGTMFTQAYTGSPVCGPSRCVLQTGKHSGHARRRDNTSTDGNKTLVPLKAADFTIAEMLKDAGYATGGCGKWGLGNAGTSGSPDKQGYDHFYGYLDQKKAHKYYVDTLWKNGKDVPVERIDGKPRYSHDSMADDMLKWIEDNHEKPFFYYAAFTIPHNEYKVPDLGIYAEVKNLSPTEKIFAAMITRMDSDVGRLMALLKKLEIDDNTIVFFTSDNGPAKIWKDDKFNSRGDQQGIKRSLFQGGVNEPMLVRWPGKIPAGKVSDFKWVFYDIMPTFAEMIGISKPESTDGISVLPTLLGKKQKPHDFIYWEFYSGFQQSIIIGDYKGIRFGTKDAMQLYKLSDDRKEANDIASSYPELVSRMTKIIDREHVDDTHWPTKEHKASSKKGKKSKKSGKSKKGKKA